MATREGKDVPPSAQRVAPQTPRTVADSNRGLQQGQRRLSGLRLPDTFSEGACTRAAIIGRKAAPAGLSISAPRAGVAGVPSDTLAFLFRMRDMGHNTLLGMDPVPMEADGMGRA